MNKKILITASMLGAIAISSCSDADNITEVNGESLLEEQSNFGKAVGNFTAEEWYSGGELGTTTKRSFSTPTTNVAADAAMQASFDKGITFFEKSYTLNEEPRKGLGPAWVRNSCIKCHPNYGHGNSVNHSSKYQAGVEGNGYLLVVYHPVEEFTSDGVRYTKENSGYIAEVTGMPQTQAMYPFKAPIDESQISIDWKTVDKMPSGLPMQFADGETYSLIYPDVNIPITAFNTNPLPTDYEVRLESTIGLYGTGLLDAITEEDMLAQWQQEAKFVDMNPGMWNKEQNTWAGDKSLDKTNGAWYRLADGTMKIKRFTYAMTRASLQDGAGANAIWNITNVTRSDRKYLYTTPAWAKAMSENEEVIDYISANGKETSSILHPYWADSKEGIAAKVNELLSMNTAAKGGDNYTKAFGQPEMSNKDYYDFMVWHRGLAVPAARDLDNPKVQQGKKVFNEIGCAQCHRPSWKTGEDKYWVDDAIKEYCKESGKDPNTCLPKFANQTIWPYTDMVQHRLFMINDIRTGWCRTTPLWGRGLSYRLTGSADRLHDCRARNEIEAIMWHGYSKDSQAYNATEKFFNLSKEDRDAVVKFLQSI
ncbi:MAG: hypothetical protein KBT34_00335 [Prevotella sp.]|nr:hypothetical protein [Candidatus Prevotella equi]